MMRPDTETRPAASMPFIGQAEKLYAIATAVGGEHIAERIAAAKKLAVHPEAEPWIVLLFISSQTPPTGDEEEQERQKALHDREMASVAVVLEHLPQNVGSSILWAMTYLLNDEVRARWSEENVFIVTRISEHKSPPIREVARNALKQRLGLDHEWSAEAWRAAIAKRDRVGSVTKDPASRESVR